MPKEVFKEKLLSLIHKFEKDKHHYLSKGYLEAEVRQDFLDPLFDALGWDIGKKKNSGPHTQRCPEIMGVKREAEKAKDNTYSGLSSFLVIIPKVVLSR